jgi:adenine-specific DNA-methyltransferase
LPSNFSNSGYFISTGPVVEHRTKEFVKNGVSGKNAVPLIKSHNFSSEYKIKWGKSDQKDSEFALLDGSAKHLVDNKVFVLVKRITSKDEPKRLIANVLIPSPKFKRIGISNKVNYLGLIDGEMTLEEAAGLAAFLNTTFMDKYFRCISGSTQVNSTEVRLFKFPKRETIIEIGNELLNINSPTQKLLDEIVSEVLNRK